MDVEEDKVSMKSAASFKSIKSACDEEKKELQLKLMENYVNDNTKFHPPPITADSNRLFCMFLIFLFFEITINNKGQWCQRKYAIGF